MDLAYSLIGITVENLSIKNKKVYNIQAQKGVMISELNNHAYLARIGARTGDVILQIDEMIIKNVKDFEKAIIKYRQKPSVVILLQRGDQLYNITVKF
jgi:S1-C subfamily serine protease